MAEFRGGILLSSERGQRQRPGSTGPSASPGGVAPTSPSPSTCTCDAELLELGVADVFCPTHGLVAFLQTLDRRPVPA